ncbi:MAG: acetyl/propionyl/methylcrotonyl-CoA carboxylase subunit alpha [Gammaproteobacteria bacterium]|uniref:acetyl/propionyl/methylcrotonyl-CoA carboxylase subunit alpha n=1 Tax=Hydrogenophaga sp. TaxID=1904254 RepID=UPI0025BC972A|nr:acetyl/propionyl/methylcrotonyl-CoA carboxylase subunit alpha [Hydrogenophaga sp.]MBU4180386.1 acetyl/propionyl/methylcrotonyl-CoA carboxylase subunit alpha [Gammaproteobacteria bacterium]MBU4282676.1 acetyl/propionyl/methylcrotonyl-CoA carboxylase subunit alpha [Gammaproteobacteria bacterium]MBU4324916.1 acetyl/propionyl/methylcrotonyl-CoA carboxylase subunit alpha [Gammaproteobacteria bacterium]MBU4507155.1 acetyl/propionyl/methylcrotonyl-CoA carboxylase subunit alpha [Gammaproteobacteria 
MFTKILIANRGEIACRVAATARRMGVRTVAVYSDADASAKHVAACDEAVHIGGSAPKDSYLQWQRILDAAKATGAQAIHPGYGFLSENEAFANACAEAGLVFIGPPASAIQAMGLKAESKRLMESAGVPLVPGYHGADQDPHMLQHEADRIGYPVLIKASAGGGGKGMRAVEKAEDFAAALASCKREAINSFGSDAVLVEKYAQRPRHIEIQVFGDTHGNCVYLFERDCSVQRRHQKVLEEAPAPGMTPELRQQMGLAAVAAARAVNYVGAGTVEFIVEQPPEGGMRFYFMEMNTRLQVEHPVTEAITGLDLVEWQLRVASGEPLPLTQEQLHIDGHAIEARICAETPDNQFLPATGRLDVYRKPACTSFERGAVRVDDGVREGDAISPFYDSMVAKLIVHGRTRAEALARLDAALAETRIVGLSTNVQFLRHVVASPSFAQANLDTALIPREAGVLFNQDKVGPNLAVAAAVAQTLLAERASEGKDPFSRRDGWRPHGLTVRRFDFEYLGEAMQASLTYLHDGALQLALGEVSGLLTFHALPAENGTLMDLRFMGQRQTVQTWQREEIVHIFCALGATQITELDALAHAGEAAHDVGRLTAPMPGKVVSFAVKAGDAVKKGQPLAVMEAMKMEHTIAAPADGTVAELLYAPGDQVAEGAELLKIQTA